MIRADGKTLEECFANAGYALFDQTVDLSTVDVCDSIHLEVEGEELEEKLYAFLSELLFIEDCDNLILKELTVQFDGDRVLCDGRGEYLNKEKHRTFGEVKAVTYHMMSVEPDVPSVTVIYDI